VAVILLCVSCGKGGDRKSAKKDAGGPTAPVAAPIALPTIGVEKIARFNYVYDAGKAAYDKAEAAAKKKDWAETRKQAEASLAKDANHMDAHRLLAVALAQLGEHAAVVDHLVGVIAADYYNYGVSYATDPLLEGFRATEHGKAVTQLAAQLRDEWAKKIASGLWFIARRSAFRYDKYGSQWLSSRGELYAFDRETMRYFRLTHTNHQVAGFVRARTANEIAVLGFDKGDRPKDDNAAPLIARGWAQTFDTTEWKSTSKIVLPQARANAIYYGEGDQLLVAQAPAADRWTLGEWTVSSVDRTTNKLTKTAGAPGAPRVEMTLDEGRIVLPPVIDGVQGAWSGTPARAPELTIGSTKILVPETGQAAQETIAVAPGGAWVAFATAVDPCAKDTAPSLYVANAKTGAPKHLLTAKSRFATRWLDANTLAYEDGDSAIRLWDATTGREAMRIENKAGVALAVLSLASAPLCKQAPPSAEPTGSAGTSDEMPPEEPGGPVTQPR
jgi:hypothetical protein